MSVISRGLEGAEKSYALGNVESEGCNVTFDPSTDFMRPENYLTKKDSL